MVFSDRKQNSHGKNKRKGGNFHESAVTILTPGCHFNGKLYCRGSSRIGGKIEGEIVSEGLLIIEEGATIIAKIRADEAIIQGEVKGTLDATGRVKLEATSRFEGDIITPSLIVHEGAQFNGYSSMRCEKEQPKELSPMPVVEKLHKKGAQAKDQKEAVMPQIELRP